jgi:hypothetical protein
MLGTWVVQWQSRSSFYNIRVFTVRAHTKGSDAWEQRQQVEKVQKREVEGHLKYKLHQLYIIVQRPACDNCLEFKESQLFSVPVMGPIGGSCLLLSNNSFSSIHD